MSRNTRNEGPYTNGKIVIVTTAQTPDAGHYFYAVKTLGGTGTFDSTGNTLIGSAGTVANGLAVAVGDGIVPIAPHSALKFATVTQAVLYQARLIP